MLHFKRFFLFTLVRAFMRLQWQRQALAEVRRELEQLTREAARTRRGALVLARHIKLQDGPVRDRCDAEIARLRSKHESEVRALLEQLRVGAEARLVLAREVIAKNGEIEERDTEIAKLRETAITDPLTGLYNRRGAGTALARLLSVFERQSQRSVETGGRAEVHDLSVLVFDLNHFKLVNDRFGHRAGDVVLAIIADHIKRAFRAEDVLVRPGGDEFKAYLVNATRDGAIARAQALSALMLADERLSFEGVRVTVSIGISHGRFATKRGGLQIVETLEELADTAMYHAKDDSREVNSIIVAPDAVSSDTVIGDL